MILSCHGDDEGILVPDEPPITPEDIRRQAHLNGKTIVNLGCRTRLMAPAFHAAGTTAYIGPTDYPDGAGALAFAANVPCAPVTFPCLKPPGSNPNVSSSP